MRIVNNKSELEKALAAHERCIQTTDSKFKKKMQLAEKWQHRKGVGAFATPNAISEISAGIIITIVLAIAVVTIIAILNKYKARIKVNPKTGDITLEYFF